MIDNKTIRKVIMLNKMLPSGSPTYENREASGAVANFETNVVMPFVKCECTIDATESGTDELTLNHKGKNLVDVAGRTITSQTTVLSGVDFKKGTYIVSADVKNNGTVRGNIRVIKTGTSIILAEIQCLEGDDTRKSSSSFTLSEDMKLSILCNGASAGYSFSFDNLQIELGSTATTFEPYNAETYTVTLDEAAYGGSVDVIAGTGQIIDEYGKLVYTLFEPVIISALEGVNNVWCDTGNTKVTYKYKTGEGGSSNKKYLPIFYDFYGKEKYK